MDFTWREASFTTEGGGVQRVYAVCHVVPEETDNWLRTPFINSQGANRIHIEIKFTMRKCLKYLLKQCKESFRLYYLLKDEDTEGDELNKMNYQHLDVIAANKVFTESAENQINTEVRSADMQDKAGIYFAFQDSGACITLLAIRIFLIVCPQSVMGMALFRQTHTGRDLSSIVQVEGECAVNSVQGLNKPSYLCKGNGFWYLYTGECTCKPGYHSDAALTACIACAANHYKNEAGFQACVTCPEGSQSEEGSVECVCKEGLFQTGANLPCYEPPPVPRDLQAYFVNQSSLKLHWKASGDDHVWYDVTCQECDQDVIYTPSQSHINANRVSVDHLQPSSSYTFHIYAHNHITHLTTPRHNHITIMTRPPVPAKLLNLHVTSVGLHHVSLTWEAPINLKVDHYDVSIFQENKYVGEGSHGHDDDGEQVSDDDDDDRGGDDSHGGSDVGEGASLQQSQKSYKNTKKSVRYYKNKESENQKKSQIYKIGDANGGDKIGNSGVKLISRNEPYISYNNNNVHNNNVHNNHKNINNNKTIMSTKYNNFTFTSLAPYTKYFFQVKVKSKRQVLEYSEVISAITGISRQPSTTASFIAASSIILLVSTLVILVVIIFLIRKNRQCKNTKLSHAEDAQKNQAISMQLYNVHPVYSQSSSVRTYVDPCTYEDVGMAVQQFTKELPANCISVDRTIGGGEFGDVCRGSLMLPGKPPLVVAIKTLKPGSSEKNKMDFLAEASVMGQFDHPNVIFLEGVVREPVFIVTEFMSNGALDEFLRRNEGMFTMLQLVGMMRGIASGMKYLSDMRFVHRDLAARNVLVSETLICKVCDFGLSREVEGEGRSGEYTTRGGKIAIRWTAPEAITYRRFTASSDVWSYGVVVWEVVTYGERPYWDWSNETVLKALEMDFNLPPPVDCPEALHHLMLSCWNRDRLGRPKFSELLKQLDLLIRSPDQLLRLTQANFKCESMGDTSTLLSLLHQQQQLQLQHQQLQQLQQQQRHQHYQQQKQQQQLIDFGATTTTATTNCITSDYTSVEEFLRGIKMERYTETFLNNGVDSLEKLVSLQLRDLISMGICLIGHQKKILNCIDNIKFPQNPFEHPL